MRKSIILLIAVVATRKAIMNHYNDPYTFLSNEEVKQLERLDDRTRCADCNTLTPNNEIREHNGDKLCSYCYNEWAKSN